MSIPYSNATSGEKAIDDIRRTLRAFGCTKFAPMEDFGEGSVAVQFEYRGRMVQVTASARGYARALMSTNGQASRKRSHKGKWTEATALQQGQIAVWSILRDWIKGQVTAVETGILSFDSAFLGQIVLQDGRTVHEHIVETRMLPAPDGEG